MENILNQVEQSTVKSSRVDGSGKEAKGSSQNWQKFSVRLLGKKILANETNIDLYGRLCLITSGVKLTLLFMK